jgi:hypothetical protein
MRTEFPPGSVGARQAGCLCEAPTQLHALCPDHGAAAQLDRMVEQIEREHWEIRVARAKGRLLWGLPLAAIVGFGLALAVNEMAEVAARAFVISFALGAFVSWLAWNRP